MALRLRRYVVRRLYNDSLMACLVEVYAKRRELQQGDQTRVVTIGVVKQSGSLVSLDFLTFIINKGKGLYRTVA